MRVTKATFSRLPTNNFYGGVRNTPPLVFIKEYAMKENSFTKGIVDGLPICFGYLAVAFAFGISAVGGGITPLEATLISMTNLTSAGQFAALPIIAAGGGLIEMALTQFIFILFYMLMSISLTQRFDGSIKLCDRFLIAFGVTDEVFGVASSKRRVGKSYMYGLILTPFIGWSLGTLLGASAGNILPSVVTTALSVAIYGMFVAIVFPDARKETPVALCSVIAILLGCAFRFIPFLSFVPEGFVIIICAVVASGIMAAIAPIKPDSEVQND